jgi:hypothetical protein
MHPITTTARQTRRRWTFAALLAALALLALAPAALAAGKTPFDGGPIAVDTSTTVANDHTVRAMRFAATTGGLYPLAASTTYYVKVRFTPNSDGSPASTANRGFVWNGGTQTWAQESDSDWTKFPTVTTDATGAITQSQWLYYKFGDTTKSGAYYLIVSLSTGITGTTKNGNVFIPVTVLDPASTGAWVHDGVSTGQVNGKRASVVDHASPGDPIALQRTEANACDDDGDGVVDNEQYGPVQAGGFRMAVPTNQLLQAKVGPSSPDWPDSAGFTITTADTDIALGAADQIAPSAPGTLTVAPRNGGAALSWAAAIDAAGVTGYRVYRWTDAPLGAGYTPEPVKVATVTGTTYTDPALTNETTYSYLVRGVDAATNVGPRSNTAAATPEGTPPGPVTGLTATGGDAHVALAWTNPTDLDFAGVKIVCKVGSSPTAPTDGTVVYDGAGTSHDDTPLINGVHYYYAAFAYDTAMNYATAADADATPNVVTKLTLSTVPAVVDWGRPWALSGELRTAGDEAVPGAVVDLQRSVNGGDTWTLVTSVDPQPGTSTYLDDVAAPLQATQYRLVYAGDAGHVASQSSPVTVTPRVKLGKPVAPSSVKKRKSFTVSGALTPKRAAGSKTVKIKCYLKRNGTWVIKKTVQATNSNHGSASRYKARFSLPSKGSWKLVASAAATAKYAATTSGTEYMKVK